MKCLYCFVLELSYSQTWVSMLPAGWQQYPISLLGLRGLKKKGFQSGDCSDSSAVGMKRVSHISAYDFRWLESTGMSNITLKSTCCEQTEWQFHPLRLIYGSSDFFKFLFTTAASQPVSIASTSLTQQHDWFIQRDVITALPLSESKVSNHLPARMKECHLQSDDMKWHTDFSALNRPCTFRLFPLHYRRLSAPSCLWTSPAWKWQLHSICVITGRSKGQNTTLKKISRTGLLYKINLKKFTTPTANNLKEEKQIDCRLFQKGFPSSLMIREQLG